MLHLDDYLKKLHPILRSAPRFHLIAAGAISVAILSLLIAPSEDATAIHQTTLNEEPATQSTTPKAALKAEPTPEAITATEELTKTSTEPKYHTDTYTVKSGDTLASLFEKSNLYARDVYNFVHSHKKAKEMTRLQPGDRLLLTLGEENELQQVTLKEDRLNSIIYTRGKKGFDRSTETIEPEKRYVYREAVIDDSLFGASSKAGLPHATAMNLANIFGWDIDFMLDIRKGDRFTLLFEEHYLDNEKIGNGPILAASFTNRGHTYKAVRFTNSKGFSHYYTPEGDSMRKEFLRNPVDFTRISSHFNLRRKHPVLNKIRAHKGTDYAAPNGTPIRAAGDGKVTFAGRKGGFGRTVIIQHGQKYKTLYAHVQKFHKRIRRGAKVKQGQTVAYVGSSGLATGPHLHYEFRVNGVVRNPMTVQLPKADPIPKSQLTEFKRQTQLLLAQLEQGSSLASLPAKIIKKS